MLARLPELLADHGGNGVRVAVAVGIFVASMAASLFLVAVMVLRLPADYFQGGDRRPAARTAGPAVHALSLIGKNLAGALLIALGVVMSLPGVPGQGLLTIFIGLTLVSFPGKRRLERRVIGFPPVLRSVNRFRQRRGRPPLEV